MAPSTIPSFSIPRQIRQNFIRDERLIRNHTYRRCFDTRMAADVSGRMKLLGPARDAATVASRGAVLIQLKREDIGPYLLASALTSRPVEKA
jgi:hypothetical protein